jgi:APA family basic amino acid/polyamine antiporter
MSASSSEPAVVAARDSKGGGLVRGLGPVEVTSIVVGGIIGSGIFISPAIVAREVQAPGLAIGVWIFAGLLATCGALCYAELSAAIPQTGGTYVFLKRAYRLPIIAFLFGWAMFFASFPGPIAAVATAFAEYAGYFLSPVMNYGTVEKRALAVLVIVILTWANVRSVRVGGKVQNVATGLKVLALVGVIVAGALFAPGSSARFQPLLPAGKTTAQLIPMFGTAMIASLFAYNGWTYSSYVGGEVRNPERSLPISILGGIGIVLVIYLAVNLVFIYALPFDQLAASSRPAADTMVASLGRVGGGVIAAAVMVSTLGAANAVLLSCSRAYFAMSGDGLFFKAMDRVHPRFHTPSNAIIAQGVMAALFALSGSFEQILTYYAFLDYLFFTMAVAGVLILRRTEPNLHRPYKAWGYPITPIMFLVVCVWYLGNTITHRFAETMVGVVLTLSGVPFYLYWTRKR